jgi:hypothetical protein
VINKHFWREILRQQDPARVFATYAHFDRENGEVIWSMPSTLDPDPSGGPSLASVEHYLEDPGPNFPTPFSRRSFPFTATGYFKRQSGLTWDQITDQWQNVSFRWNDRFFFASFPLNLAGDEDGKVYVFNTAQDAEDLGLQSFVRFGRRPIYDGRIRGLLTRVYPFVAEFNNNLNVTVLTQDSADGESHITDEFEFDQAQAIENHFVTPYRRGRYFSIEFGTDGPAEPWVISGYDVDVRPGGKR